jgi:multiple sugar transport system permease protein
MIATKSHGSYKTQRRLQMLLTYAVLAIFVIMVAFPLYWVGLTSLREAKDVYAQKEMLIPRNLTFDNYVKLFDGTAMPQWLKNTIVVTMVSTFVSLVVAIFGAYSLARLKFRGASAMGKSVLFMYLLPQTLLYIPLFVMLNDMGQLNSLNALYLAYPTFMLPFCAWLLLGYFKGLPEELEDAARIDGCSRLGVLWRIVMPLAMPGIVTAAIFSITNAWNEFLYALVFIQSDTLWTLQIGLKSFQLADTMLWGVTMAGAVITTIPPVIMYMLLQKFVVGGMTMGAVKG